MTKEEKNILKDIVKNEIKRLNDEIISLEEKSKPIKKECSLGSLIHEELMQTVKLNEAILLEMRTRLIKLNNTLNGIDSLEFGVCKVCDEEIELARLKLVPETTICMSCMVATP